MSSDQLEWLPLLAGLFGGLAIFLLGMDQLTRSLKALAGDRLEQVLNSLTRNRFSGAATGAGVTAVIQSSSITTVLVVGFVSAGLFTLTRAIPVVLGSNVGSTITAHIVAFDLGAWSLLLVAVGFAARSVGQLQRVGQIGGAVLGLGLVLFGLEVMSEAMSPLRDYEPALDLLARSDSALVGLVLGALFTALVQSSTATTGVAVVMASQGIIDLETGIGIVLGANIGTCATALLAAIGKSRDALRIALVHVVFNLLGALGWLLFVDQLASTVQALVPVDEGELASPRQLAMAHTIFNVVNTLVFLPFVAQLASLVRWMVPDRAVELDSVAHARYLDRDLLATPVLAFEVARRELARVARRVRAMTQGAVPAALSGLGGEVDHWEAADDDVDALYVQIVDFLADIDPEALGPDQPETSLALMTIANELEQLGDTVEAGVIGLGRRRLAEQVPLPAEDIDAVRTALDAVIDVFDDLVVALDEGDLEAAARVRSSKQPVGAILDEAGRELAARLASGATTVAAYTVTSGLLAQLAQLHRGCRRTARALGGISLVESDG